MEGSPLSQFVYLAKTHSGKACEALVKQVLDHSGIFVFGELLDCPNVQALGGAEGTAEGACLLELLRIFAFGTYLDYQARKADLPELTAAQRRKLQLLTVVSLATKDKCIKFADLQVPLEIGCTRELEDLIIDAVYQNLIVGKMDQESQCLNVESCFCRDCKDEDIDYIIETLSNWHNTAEKMMYAIDGMVQHSHDSYEKHRVAREELAEFVQTTKEQLKDGDAGGKSGDGGGCTRMSTDDAAEESKRSKSTRGRWVGMLPSSREQH